jgi:putative peptidoglycan lipid II flippase
VTRPHKLAGAAALISLATLLSRVLGLLREQFFAALMGASMLADAFNVAFRIPNLLRDLFAEGALSQAFVPTFKDKLRNDGPTAAYQVANRVAGTLFVFLGLLVLLAGIFAEPIVRGMAGDFQDIPGKFDLTVTLTRIMLPFLPIVSLAAVAMGMLNAQDKYNAPALAPAMFNIMSIVVGSLVYVSGVSGAWIAIGWAIGTLLGGLCQLGIQVPYLLKAGYRPNLKVDLRLRDPALRRIGRLMLPAIGGLAAVQLNIVINTIFATSEAGAVSWLNYAFRLLQLPIGVFGVAIATVSTTRFADAAASKSPEALAAHFEEGLRLVFFLTVPATIGLVLLDLPIIRLLYEHGRFGERDTAMTARALELYAVGLVAYSGIKVAAPAFYAVDRSRVPVIASVSAVTINLIISTTMHERYGFQILAFGIACGALVNFSVLYLCFHLQIGRVKHRALLWQFFRVLLASGIMGVAVWGTHHIIDVRIFGDRGATWIDVLEVSIPIAVGVAVYAVSARALQIPELDAYLGRFRRRRPPAKPEI